MRGRRRPIVRSAASGYAACGASRMSVGWLGFDTLVPFAAAWREGGFILASDPVMESRCEVKCHG